MSNTTRESPGLTPDLPALIAGLPADRRARFERIFNVELVEGELRVPDTMREWTISRFGAIEDVEHQQIVRITNKVTWEGAIFNPLRARRPMRFRDEQDRRLDVAEDIFADPARMTTEDTYGRVNGDYCITTSNIARWDAQCSVLIFQEPDPLAFTRAHLRDYFRTALRWADAAHRVDPEARFMAWMWNGGPAGGASIPHAHAQMGLGKGTPYPLVEGLHRAAVAYGGLFANLNADAIYPSASVDADGNVFNGANKYVWHLGKGEAPPVKAFWSLTLYDQEGYFVANGINRYTIGDRSTLKKNADGSIDIYIQKDSPGKDKEINWLPAPASEFNLLLRMYWPDMDKLKSGWNPVAVKKVG